MCVSYVGQTPNAGNSELTSYLKNFFLFFVVYSRDHQKAILKKITSNETGDEKSEQTVTLEVPSLRKRYRQPDSYPAPR